MDPRSPHADGSHRRRRAPPAPVPEQPHLPARPHHRDAGPALRHALALPAVRDRPRRAPLAVPRPAGGRGCRHGRDGGLGAAELVRAAGRGSRVPLLMGPPELVRAHGRRVPGGARRRGAVRPVELRQVPGRGCRRLRRAEPSVGGRDRCAGRPRRLHPMVQRAGRHRGRSHRDARDGDRLPRRDRCRRPDPRPRLAQTAYSR